MAKIYMWLLIFMSINTVVCSEIFAQKKPKYPKREIVYFTFNEVKLKNDTYKDSILINDFLNKFSKKYELTNKANIYFVDFDRDNNTEILLKRNINSNKKTKENVYELLIFMKDLKTNEYKETHKLKGILTSIEYTYRDSIVKNFSITNKSKKNNITYYNEDIYSVKKENDTLKIEKEKRRIIFENTEKPTTFYAIPYNIETTSDSTCLRLTAEEKNDKTNSNTISEYSKGTKGKAIGYLVDEYDDMWMFVEIPSQIKPKSGFIPESKNDNEVILGWIKFSQLRILKLDKKKR